MIKHKNTQNTLNHIKEKDKYILPLVVALNESNKLVNKLELYFI